VSAPRHAAAVGSDRGRPPGGRGRALLYHCRELRHPFYRAGGRPERDRDGRGRPGKPALVADGEADAHGIDRDLPDRRGPSMR
jgi:hypothetical protein